MDFFGEDVAAAQGEAQDVLEALGGFWDPVTQGFVEYGPEQGTEGGEGFHTYFPEDPGTMDPYTGLQMDPLQIGFPGAGYGGTRMGAARNVLSNLVGDLYGGPTLEEIQTGAQPGFGSDLGLGMQMYGFWDPSQDWALGREGTKQESSRHGLGTAWGDVETQLELLGYGSGMGDPGTTLSEYYKQPLGQLGDAVSTWKDQWEGLQSRL